ncbi:hypothetical protein LTS18_011960, partial [Coniosporium uncinatum]
MLSDAREAALGGPMLLARSRRAGRGEYQRDNNGGSSRSGLHGPSLRVTGQFFETVVATKTPVTVSSSRGRRVYQSVSDDVNNIIECLHCLGVGLFGTKDGAPLS